jgi:hypothetical protein
LSRLPDEHEALGESAEICSDRTAIAALEEGLGEIERDETVTLEELREELAAARQAAN